MVRDYELAEELFQETVIEILKSEERFDPTRRFVPWACGIARNVVLQHWRKNSKVASSGLTDLISELAIVASEGDDESWRQERIALQNCVQRLPQKMQRLVLLRYGHNIKGNELAKMSRIRAGSIRTTLSRLRSKLRCCIQAKLANSPEDWATS